MGMGPREYTLALGMLITGSINTITTKFADLEFAVGLDGTYRIFNHPFYQALGMFFGEFLCSFVFRFMLWDARRKGKPSPDKSRPFSPVVFLAPALCDMTATSLMYLGLTLTDASVFQMLRGSVVIFTGLLSVVFLKRKLQPFQWWSIFLVLIGTFLVGYSSISAGSSGASAKDPTLGAILVIIAQIIQATQMVVEEKFVGGYDISALEAVGWEGAWGASVLSVVLIPLYFIPSNSGVNGRFENSFDGFEQMGHSWVLTGAVLGNLFSIAFFNYFGISVTKAMSASHRMVLDTLRTIVIWIWSISYGWESEVYAIQLVGFIVVILGTVLYNEVIRIRFLFQYEGDVEGDSFMALTPPGGKSRPWWKRWIRRDKDGEATVEDSLTPHLSRWNYNQK